MWFLFMGLSQGSGLCSSSSRKYPRNESTNQNRHCNHHRWHATNSLKQTRLSCWCSQNHKQCIYSAPVKYVSKLWSVVLLNKKYIYSYLKCIVCDRLLKPWQSFRITLYLCYGEMNYGLRLKRRGNWDQAERISSVCTLRPAILLWCPIHLFPVRCYHGNKWQTLKQINCLPYILQWY